MWAPSPAEIQKAQSRIDPVFLNTPLRRCAKLDQEYGASLLFKDETANPIRCFKGRGASNFINQLDRSGPLVCASAGNFGQGLAWAARAAGLDLTVYSPRKAVDSKVQAMRAIGATVLLEGEDFDSAKDAAAKHARSEGAFYVEDGAHAAIADGAGTIALEICREERFDVILCPLGNGALAAGIGCWVKSIPKPPDMIAVCAAGAPAMALSVLGDSIVSTETASTIADGIAVRVPIASAVDAVRKVVDDVVLVEDGQILAAMAVLREALGLVVEPAGAAGFAALLSSPDRWRGKTIAIPLCGGNVDGERPHPQAVGQRPADAFVGPLGAGSSAAAGNQE